MAFQKGNKLGGRTAGALSRRTVEVVEIADRLAINPFEVLMLFVKGDWEALGYDSSVIVKANASGETFMEYTISPELRAQCARDACKYLYPQKKSIEHVKNNPLEGMTPEQKLEAMRQAVKMLEGEIGK